MIAATAVSFAQPLFRANGKIAFTSDRDGNREIYVMDADGKNEVRLTSNTIVDDNPAWSPDGRKLAFVSQNATGAFGVFLMNGDGTRRSEITPITPLPFRYKLISWSPDGTRLAISQANGIDIVDADGNNRRSLTFGFDAAWSPDGSKILFATPRISGNPGTLKTINPDGTGLRTFLDGVSLLGYQIVGYPDWSPDGSRVALIGSDTANQDIFTTNSDGTRTQFFTGECGGLSPQGCGYITSLDWSPDGTKMVYGAYGNLYSVDQFGNDRTVLAFIGTNSNPSWQPLASEVVIAGRVTTPGGQGLSNAIVILTGTNGIRMTTTTSSFGLYTFSNVPIDETYTASVASRRYRFAARTITASGDLTDVDFVGLE